MRYLLDTNIISYAIRNRDEGLMARLEREGRQRVCTSALVQFELEFGAQLRDSPRLWRSIRAILAGLEVLTVTPRDAQTMARIAADLRQRGRPIGPLDTLIAGHALARDLVLVTHNTRHFCEVEGLAVEGWCGEV